MNFLILLNFKTINDSRISKKKFLHHPTPIIGQSDLVINLKIKYHVIHVFRKHFHFYKSKFLLFRSFHEF
jgi:hypothetical protein